MRFYPRANSLSRWEMPGLLGVFILAALLRFGWPGTRSFAFDEAYVSRAALTMTHGGSGTLALAAIGMPSSAGVPNLPGAIWLFSIPFALSPDPLFASAFVGALSLAAIGGCWWLARQQWGALAGIAAGLFMAASPYSVLYARSIWAQDLLPLLSVLWLLSAIRTTQDKRRWVALNILVAALAVDIHYAGIALALATIWLGLRQRWWRRSILPGVLVGGGLVLILLAPTVYYVLSRDPGLIDQIGHVVGGTSQIDLSAPGQLLQIGLGLNWKYLALGDLDTFSTLWLPAAAIGVLLLAGLIVSLRAIFLRNSAVQDAQNTLNVQGAINTFPSVARTKDTSAKRYLPELTLVILITSFLWLIRHSTPPLPQYQLVALPSLALLIGASVTLLKNRAWRILTMGIVIIAACAWSVEIGYSLNIAGQNDTPNGLGTPLAISQRIADSIPDNTPAILFTHGDDPTIDGEPAVFSVLWWRRSDRRIVDGETTLILPRVPTQLLSTVQSFQAWEELDAAGLVQQAQIIPRRIGAGPMLSTLYDGLTVPSGFTAGAPVQFADGLELHGWRVRKVGNRMRVSTLWQVLATPTLAAIQQFNHLNTAATLNSAPFLGSDVPISVRALRQGDSLIVMADFSPPPPAGTYWLDFGHYTLDTMQRIAIVSPANQPNDLVRVGPFTWP